MFDFEILFPFVLAFEGEDEAAAKAAEEAAAKAEAEKNKGKTTFTQDDVNRMLAVEKAKFNSQREKTISELKAIQATAKMTAEQKTQLEQRIEQLEGEHLTKEQVAKREHDKALKKAQTDNEDLAKKQTFWQTKYATSTIVGSITSAAAADAFDVEQVVMLLQPKAKLVPILDEEGVETGEFETKISFKDVDDKNKPVTLILTPEETIKRMKEIPKYDNLWKAEGKSGLGFRTATKGKGGEVDHTKLTPEDYRKLRKEGKI